MVCGAITALTKKPQRRYGWGALTPRVSQLAASAVYFYPWALELERLYQWRMSSTALWINRTAHSGFLPLLPSGGGEVTLGSGRGFISLLLCLLCRATGPSLAGRVPSEDNTPPVIHFGVSLYRFGRGGNVDWAKPLPVLGHEGGALIGRHYRRPWFFFFITLLYYIYFIWHNVLVLGTK